jgi:hypothetical protein
MFLALNLLKQGLVSLDELLAAAQKQQLTRAPIGKLAIQEGKLSMAQVFKVLETQATDPRPFGQIAIDMHFLDDESLCDLLLLQAGSEQPICEILLEMGFVTQKQIDREALRLRQESLRRADDEVAQVCLARCGSDSI